MGLRGCVAYLTSTRGSGQKRTRPRRPCRCTARGQGYDDLVSGGSGEWSGGSGEWSGGSGEWGYVRVR